MITLLVYRPDFKAVEKIQNQNIQELNFGNLESKKKFFIVKKFITDLFRSI